VWTRNRNRRVWQDGLLVGSYSNLAQASPIRDLAPGTDMNAIGHPRKVLDDLHDQIVSRRTMSTCVLVASCDQYADLWPVFLSLFYRAWPDCPYSVYLGSNHLECNDARVKGILVGDDRGWGRGIREMLRRIESTHVLVLLEDFLLLSRVDTDLVLRLERQLIELDGAYLRLRPFPAPDYPLARYPLFGENALGAPYRCSMQVALWRKESLLDLLVDQESPWGFELNGARRSDISARGFYCTWSHVFNYYAGVARGKWIPYGVAVCRERGVFPNLTARPMMTPKENMQRTVRRAIHEVLSLVPWRLRDHGARWLRASALRRPRTIA